MKFSAALLAGFGLCLVLVPHTANAQVPRGACMISDPTGTPLNVRAGPNGAVVGRLFNGDVVVMTGAIAQDRGRPWAQISTPNSGVRGWVFREFISCRN